MAHPGIVFLDETPRVRRKANPLGVLGLVFSILGIFSFGLVSPIGLGISALAMLGRPRGAAVAGTVMGALGTGFLLLWGGAVMAGINAANHAAGVERTQASMSAAVATIEQYQTDYGRLPEGVDGNKLLISAEMSDAWGQPLRYDRLGEQSFHIRSAGPDKRFDTADDLTRP